ncbi:MAG: hypothetical protein ACYC1T_06880 [Sulfuricaulis sp.]
MNPTGKLEVVVALAEFVGILKGARFGTKLGKRNIAREHVTFRFDGTKLTVTIVDIAHTLPARGSWEGTVTVTLTFMGRFSKCPPTQDPLVIRYEDARLKIGTTSFPATWAP